MKAVRQVFFNYRAKISRILYLIVVNFQTLNLIKVRNVLYFCTSIFSLKEFDIDFYMRLMWIDPRLNFTHLTNDTNTEKNILVEPPEQVWIPDVFMDNSKHASFHMVTKKNEMLRLWPNGSLFYSVRYVTDFNCI